MIHYFKKWLAVLTILTSVWTIRPSYAQESISPQALESFIRRICPMSNEPRGTMLEQRFEIAEFRDGKWTCNDRAEVAKRIATQYGYDTAYGIDKTSNPKIFHRFIIVSDQEGHAYDILRSRLTPRHSTDNFLNLKPQDVLDHSE